MMSDNAKTLAGTDFRMGGNPAPFAQLPQPDGIPAVMHSLEDLMGIYAAAGGNAAGTGESAWPGFGAAGLLETRGRRGQLHNSWVLAQCRAGCRARGRGTV